jgi:hypothetical protein
MQEEINEERERRPIKIFRILLPSLPSLMFRFSGTFLRFKKDAQKAGKVFKKELVKQGIDKHTAEELTEIYMEGSHIRNYIQNMQ